MVGITQVNNNYLNYQNPKLQQGNKTRKQISFESNNPLKTKNNISTTTKVTIGTGLALSLGVVGDLIFAKGKHIKNLINMVKGQKEVETAVKDLPQLVESGKNPFEAMGLSVSNGIVKDEKGLYTGAFRYLKKDGTEVTLVYKDGKISKSKIMGNGKYETKDYYYNYNNGKMKSVRTNDISGNEISSLEINRDWYGNEITETTVKKPDKTIQYKVERDMKINHYDNNDIYSSGLRQNMPHESYNHVLGYKQDYIPGKTSITEVTDSMGNRHITRRFSNDVGYDVLNLSPKGNSGTIEHFTSNGRRISEIKRTPGETYENYESYTSLEFGGGSHDAGHNTVSHHYTDNYFKNEKPVDTKEGYIDASVTYDW